jgi:hypothetical protein
LICFPDIFFFLPTTLKLSRISNKYPWGCAVSVYQELNTKNSMRYPLLFFILIQWFFLNAQCPTSSAIIYQSSDTLISFDKIAEAAAPMLWFSPDEPELYDANRDIQLPQAMPFDEPSTTPILYYKIRNVYTENKTLDLKSGKSTLERSEKLNLSNVIALEIEYYHYYEIETGLGGHPHDIESVMMQLKVHGNLDCEKGEYCLEVKRVVARSHGQFWFENAITVDVQTYFPMSILVEEGKHASVTDKNADGVYTPGYDVTEKVNDAWGLRDIISTGRLFSGGFQAWMAKRRIPQTLILPPNYKNSKSFNLIQDRFPEYDFTAFYKLRPFPSMPENLKETDRLLYHKIVEKRYEEWPKIKTSVPKNKKFERLSKEKKLSNKVGFSYRWDEGQGLSMSFPLLFVKHVEAPMTGGWFYNKFYLGSTSTNTTFNGIDRVFGHQIQHTTSASRWIDTYVGLGWELFDLDPAEGQYQHKVYMASELGLKIRLNITKTPLKFLRFLGTDYWGLRIGWKNLGFNPFVSNGFVVEFGAGAF